MHNAQQQQYQHIYIWPAKYEADDKEIEQKIYYYYESMAFASSISFEHRHRRYYCCCHVLQTFGLLKWLLVTVALSLCRLIDIL